MGLSGSLSHVRDGEMLPLHCERFEPGAELTRVITFVQPDRYARDRDNLLAACWPMLDGVAGTLGVNESQFEPVTIRHEYGKKPGAARVQILAAVLT